MATRRAWANDLFKHIDAMDTEAFLGFLAEDVLFQFGNAIPRRGRVDTGAAVREFFDSIMSLRHDLIEIWDQVDTLICHGYVTYARHDASTLRVPFANILRIHSGLIAEYRIYVDVSELHRAL